MDLSGTTLSATMRHVKGVAEIELKTATYYAIAEANNGTSTITRTSNTNESVKASNSFASTGSYHVPVQKGSTDYYYAVVQTGTATTQFNSNSGTDQWASAYTATEIASGGLGHFEAYSTRVGTSTYSGQFSYSGTYLTFTVPFTGTYTIECWGASGGTQNNSYAKGGNGGYTKGTISLSISSILLIYIGGKGTASSLVGGWNGGGASGFNGTSQTASGGGATDIRTKDGLNESQLSSWTTDWNNSCALRGRIMVAAGGGGGGEGASNYIAHGGIAGGLIGGTATSANTSSYPHVPGGEQTKAGTPPESYYTDRRGYFGYSTQTSNTNSWGGGGGSGYWGGCKGWGTGGSGGSSYISGHAGCVAIASAAETTASTAGTANSVERATHYSGLKFTNTKIIDGAGYAWTTAKGSAETMPTPPEGTISSGNVGNGYCRITGTTATP